MPPCNIHCSQKFKFPLRIPGIPITQDFFKSLLLVQLLFDHSEFFTRETRHIVPACNRVRISNFCLEFQELKISLKHYSLSSYSIILIFFTKETRHIVPPCNKAGISSFCLEFQIYLKCYSSFSCYSIILNFFTRETRHVVPPCNKVRI